MEPKKIHKFKDDDSKSLLTACGQFIQPGSNRLVVNKDMRKATCGNCQRVPSKRKIAK